MPTLNDVLAGSLAQAVNVQQIIDALKGTPSKGVPIALVSLNDSANYALSVQNDDPTNSRALSVLKSDGTTLISADATGVTLGGTLHLPTGAITSAMIAPGAVTIMTVLAGVSVSPQTSSTTMVDIPDLLYSGVPTTTTGSFYVQLNICWAHSVAYGAVFLDVTVDGTSFVQNLVGSGAAGSPVSTSVSYVFSPIAAGTHTVHARWSTPSGTLTAYQIYRSLTLVQSFR